MFQKKISVEGICVHCSKKLKMITDPEPKCVNDVWQIVFERCSCSKPANDSPLETCDGCIEPYCVHRVDDVRCMGYRME